MSMWRRERLRWVLEGNQCYKRWRILLFPFILELMIFEWDIWLLKHAGCLACLQHCLMHWVSLVGDLALSPGGLRVHARARLVFQHHPPGQRYCCNSIILYCRVFSWRFRNTSSFSFFSEGESFFPLEDQIGGHWSWFADLGTWPKRSIPLTAQSLLVIALFSWCICSEGLQIDLRVKSQVWGSSFHLEIHWRRSNSVFSSSLAFSIELHIWVATAAQQLRHFHVLLKSPRGI